jgi:hypothetical protein
MTAESEKDINRIIRKDIKTLPQKQRTFVLTHIKAICLGTMKRESALLAIRGKFGVRAEVVAVKILNNALNPTVTSETMQP